MDDRFEDERKITISEKQKEERWNHIHSRESNREQIRQQYDGWLETDKRIVEQLEKCKTPILDLDCGVGIDTLHLVENGHRVVACDFAQVAIDKIKQNVPEARTLKFNMKNPFPFAEELFEFIIANKSIHYFSEQETRNIISEVYRILKPDGNFAFVVNSTNDSNFGVGQGRILEKDFYEVRGTTKRFFDKNSLEEFFDKEHWEFICMNENKIQGERIKTIQLQATEKPSEKIAWTCMVKRK